MQDFQDRVAVVTGAASGIGRALVEAFVAEGAQVAAVDIDEPGLADTAALVPTDRVSTHTVNVIDAAAVDALADHVYQRWGRTDVLCNNAGVFQGGLLWERKPEDWEWTMGVNFNGVLNGITSFVPRMIAQDSEGHIVNTSSVAAFVTGAFASPYCVSKSACFALTECLALDLAAVGSKLRASVLTPSAIDTAISSTARVRPDELAAEQSDDAHFVAASLSDMTSGGMAPSEAAAAVLAGIRAEDFVIATKPSYREQLRNRFEALLDREIPGPVEVD